MIQFAGTIVFIIIILVFFALDRNREARTSKALWIPVTWFFLAGSRPVSYWLHMRMIGTSADDLLEGSPLDRGVITVLIALALMVLIARGQKVGAVLRANAPILLFLAYCGVSIFWSDFPDVAFKRFVRAIGDFAMILVVLTDFAPSVAVERALGWAGFIIFPLSILFELGRGYSGLGYHAGVATDKNMFGMISLILGLAAIWRFQILVRDKEAKDRTRRLMARGAISAIAIWCIWTAMSATSTACFLVGTALISLARRWAPARKAVLLHVFVVSVIFLALYASILNPNVGIASAMGKDPTLTGRTDVWHTVIGMAPSPLFGAGFESFWLGPRLKKLWTIYVWRPNEAHNGYIELYLNLGWVGLGLLALVVMAGYRRVISRLRLYPDIGNLAVTYLVVAIIYSLTEAGFRIFSLVWIALLLSISSVFEPEPKNARPTEAIATNKTTPKLWTNKRRTAPLVADSNCRKVTA
jgi:exopolysaccharide production protein ExoQ